MEAQACSPSLILPQGGEGTTLMRLPQDLNPGLALQETGGGTVGSWVRSLDAGHWAAGGRGAGQVPQVTGFREAPPASTGGESSQSSSLQKPKRCPGFPWECGR